MAARDLAPSAPSPLGTRTRRRLHTRGGFANDVVRCAPLRIEGVRVKAFLTAQRSGNQSALC